MDLQTWLLQKSIPGAKDESIGETGRPTPTSGPRTSMDERTGNTPAEVSRPEDGGRVNGLGASPGAMTLKDYVGKAGLGHDRSQGGPAYGAAQAPADNAVPDEEEKLDGDSPKRVGEIPAKNTLESAPTSPSQTPDAANRIGAGGKDLPSYATGAPASAPKTGAAGLGEDRSQGGPAYGANTKTPASAALPSMGGVPDLKKSAPYEEARKLSALAASVLRKGEARVEIKGAPTIQRGVQHELKSAQILVKGGIVISTVEDAEITDMLEKSDGAPITLAPHVGLMRSPLMRVDVCPKCTGHFAKALTTCPHCGSDGTTGAALQKSEARPPGRLRPPARRMIDGTNGLSLA